MAEFKEPYLPGDFEISDPSYLWHDIGPAAAKDNLNGSRGLSDLDARESLEKIYSPEAIRDILTKNEFRELTTTFDGMLMDSTIPPDRIQAYRRRYLELNGRSVRNPSPDIAEQLDKELNTLIEEVKAEKEARGDYNSDEPRPMRGPGQSDRDYNNTLRRDRMNNSSSILSLPEGPKFPLLGPGRSENNPGNTLLSPPTVLLPEEPQPKLLNEAPLDLQEQGLPEPRSRVIPQPRTGSNPRLEVNLIHPSLIPEESLNYSDGYGPAPSAASALASKANPFYGVVTPAAAAINGARDIGLAAIGGGAEDYTLKSDTARRDMMSPGGNVRMTHDLLQNSANPQLASGRLRKLWTSNGYMPQ